MIVPNIPRLVGGAARWLTRQNPVEAVVIIILLAVCLSVGLPWLTNARERARRTQVFNNLRQMATGIGAYGDMYQTFPLGGRRDQKESNNGTNDHMRGDEVPQDVEE